MPLIKLSASLEYFLINHDDNGLERREADGTLLSDVVFNLLDDPNASYTDVFLMSHGWKGDLPAAREQYNAWLRAVAGDENGLQAAYARDHRFHPLVVGLHWPSLPWGDENMEAEAPTLLGSDPDAASEEQIARWAHRIADTPAARNAIETILTGAAADNPDANLPEAMRAAYAVLHQETGIANGDSTGRPGSDHAPFDPDAIIEDARSAPLEMNVPEHANEPPLLLGDGWLASTRDLFLMPLRQLSFWTMKDRARRFGEASGHAFVRRLQDQSAKRPLRIHLMGHSFGCIVVCAAVCGSPDDAHARRPVQSLFLVQGALSLWAFASDIPHVPETSGYFHRLTDQLVEGSILATRSRHDRAVGWFYPLGARTAGQFVLNDALPLYGGVGAFGIQGTAGSQDQPLHSDSGPFRAGGIYNLEASEVIRNGGGFSGAHSDIVHPEVTGAFWRGVLSVFPPLAANPFAIGPDGIFDSAKLLGTDTFEAIIPRELTPTFTAPSFHVSPVPRPFTVPMPMAVRDENSWASGSIAGFSTVLLPPLPSSGTFFSFPDLSLASANISAERPAAPPADGIAEAARWVNAGLEGHPGDTPLQEGRWYTLAVDIDVLARQTASAAVPFLGEAFFRSPDDLLKVTVQVASEDFETAQATRELTLAATGPSLKPARFGISPRHEGLCKLRITLHREGNFIQQLELAFRTGGEGEASAGVEAVGRPLLAATAIGRRDVGILLRRTDRGYDCIVWGEVAAQAVLDLDPAAVAEMLDTFRARLLEVVSFRDATNKLVFQSGIAIPPDANAAALKILARAGAGLFQKLFFGPNAGADAKAVGDYLRRRLGGEGPPLKLQVVTLGVPIPWACLYLGDAAAGVPLDWNSFLGLRHVVEQIPLQPDLAVYGADMPSDQPRLGVSLNLNTAIDGQMKVDVIRTQIDYWMKAAQTRRVALTQRSTRAEVIHGLNDPADEGQFLYFYCHADTVGLNERGGPDASSITLSDGKLVLGDLRLDAPASRTLKGAPLVFINACESAALSPLFYDGFVPYFMAKGARGVVGTECNTPALFAREWALAFFDRFLDGGAVGESFLALRQHFLVQYRNPLGLLYAVHCDGDTRIAPAPA